jgi:hypothetical protein
MMRNCAELIALDRRNVDRLACGDPAKDCLTKTAGNSFDIAKEACEKIDGLVSALKADKLLSDQGRSAKFAKEMPAHRDRALAAIERARSSIEAKIATLNAEMAAPPTPDEELARREANLVVAIRGMSRQEKESLLMGEALNDPEVSASLLRNHAMALGISATMLESFRTEWQRRTFPEKQREVERLATTIGYLDRAKPVVEKFISDRSKFGGLTIVSGYQETRRWGVPKAKGVSATNAAG